MASKPITGSDLLVASLQAEGVDTLFGIAGDHILHMLDVMVDHPFRMIDTRHESAAVHAADSYARILRRGGVVLSTTPGHANAVSGLANAVHSEAPVINIAGSADSPNLGRGAMQEFDQVGIAAPVTKGAWQVPSPGRIPEYVSLAFRTAMSGRRGPVHLTIPHDFQSAEVDMAEYERYAPTEYGWSPTVRAAEDAISAALEVMSSARRPLFMAGSSAGATADPDSVRALVEATGIPFVSEDSARGLIPDSHDYSLGLGYLPLNPAAQLVAEADVVVMLGKRLDYTLAYGGSPPFADGVQFVVVDPSPAEIGRARSVAVGVLGDVGAAIEQMLERVGDYKWAPDPAWLARLKSAKSAWISSLDELADESDPIHPMLVSDTLQRFLEPDGHMTFDGGDYCHFLRASIPRDEPFRFHNVSSFGMIGVGVAYALGAQVALPDKQCVVAVGDGSFGFNGMELDTMVRHRLPVKIILGNNGIWGIDWQIQRGIYGRDVWTDLADSVRYDLVARGLGAHGEHVRHADELEPALRRAFNHDGPALVNIEVDQVISPVATEAINRKLGAHG